MTHSYDIMRHVAHIKICSVLQCVAVCCSVLQCDAVCCNVLSRADTHSYGVRGARDVAISGVVAYHDLFTYVICICYLHMLFARAT